MRFKTWLENEEGEKIVQAAFSIDGKIYPSGPIHLSSVIPDSEYGKDWVAGFLTNKGRFLNRKEAAVFVSGLAGGKYRQMDATELRGGSVDEFKPPRI
jgi:hypothetical protein